MILFQIKILDKLKMPKESHRQDLATLKASACAVRDDIAFFESENDEHFTSEPASKKSLEHYEKNKNKLKELEKKIMLLSPKFLLQVNLFNLNEKLVVAVVGYEINLVDRTSTGQERNRIG